MSNKDWLNDLLELVTRFSYLNIDADLASLTHAELWALYLHLNRLVES